MLIQIQLVRLLVGSLVRLLVGKSYHSEQKDGYSLPTNDPTNNRTNWIWTSKKIGLKLLEGLPFVKISENIKKGPKNLKNVSSENLGKINELPSVGKSQRSL